MIQFTFQRNLLLTSSFVSVLIPYIFVISDSSPSKHGKGNAYIGHLIRWKIDIQLVQGKCCKYIDLYRDTTTWRKYRAQGSIMAT